MNKDRMSEKMIQSIHGELSQSEESEMQLMIESDPAAREEYDSFSKIWEELKMIKSQETPAREIKRFETWLQSQVTNESKQSEKSRNAELKWWKYAAAASILLVFMLIGLDYVWKVQSSRSELHTQKESLFRLVSADNTTSRIKGINEYYQMETLDGEVRDALLRVLEDDESINVRLAALDAVSNLINDEKVKKTLIRILEDDSEPGIQMAIINVLVKLKDGGGVRKTLEELLESESVPDDVKEEAFIGITRL
jgi:hypothetical protein